MQIIGASLYSQFQKFVGGPYRCRNQSETGFDSTLVKLETDSGIFGWGESDGAESWETNSMFFLKFRH